MQLASPVTHPVWRILHTEASLGWGGQERRIVAEMEGFRRRGSWVGLTTPEGARIGEQARIRQIPCSALSLVRWRFPFEICRLAAAFRRDRVQILNPHSSRDSWMAGLAGRMARVPLIIRSRHFDIPIGSPAVSRFAYRRLADHIITTSPRITEAFRELFYLSADRISTIPTGIDMEVFKPSGERLAESWQVPIGAIPLVGMIGVFRWAKGHEILLQASRLLADQGFPIHCVLVGEGPGVERIRNLAAELRLSDAVTFLGEHNDVPRILRALKVLAMPSLHEGIPQVGLQALACGVPLVASDVGGLPFIVRDGETGCLVKPGDPGALAAGLQRVLQSPDLSQRMAERGRIFVETHHSLERMLDSLQSLYLRHLTQRPAV